MQSGHADERAVATEDDDEVAGVRQILARLRGPSGRKTDERRGVGFEHGLDSARLEPSRHFGEDAGRGVEVVLGHEPDTGNGACSCVRPCQVKEEFAIPFHAGDG